MWPVERIWRLLATGVLHIGFGIGSVFLGILVMVPLALLCFNKPEVRVKCWRRTIQWAFAVFVWSAEQLGVLSVRFINVAGLRQPGQLIIANHPSLLDVIILISRLPDVDCVIKRQLSRNPFVSLQVWLADYVRNDAGEGVVRECARRLDAGRSLIVFPEGTRTKRGKPLKFLRGTARTILACEAPVRPVVVRCHPQSLAKGDAWYRVPERKIEYRFIVEPCLNVDPFRDSKDPESVRARHLTSWLEEWFTRRLDPTEVNREPITT